jgi:hypothetical protein
MPDLLDYSVTRIANAQLTVPRWSIAGRIVDSQDQSIEIQDFSGSPIIFPTVLGNLSAAQQDRWVEEVVRDLIYRRFGLA